MNTTKKGNLTFYINEQDGSVKCSLKAFGQEFIGEARMRPDEEHPWNEKLGTTIAELRANIEMRKYNIILIQYFIATQKNGIEQSIDLFYKDSNLFMHAIQKATEDMKKHQLQVKKLEKALEALLAVA